MTFADNFAIRLTRVDTLTRQDHWHLTTDDLCYYIGEYTARQGYTYSHTNSLILNFKKPVDRRERPEWRYKLAAIQEAADAFRRGMSTEALDRLTFIPIPPSKARDDPKYDDRLTQMLKAIRRQPALDIRELIVQTESAKAAHDREERPRPRQIEALYKVDETLSVPAPNAIAVVDDLLTTGAHFKAAQSVLVAQFPGIPVIGLFIARRVPNTAELDDLGH